MSDVAKKLRETEELVLILVAKHGDLRTENERLRELLRETKTLVIAWNGLTGLHTPLGDAIDVALRGGTSQPAAESGEGNSGQ